MTKFLSTFNHVDGLDGVFTAEKGNLRCNAIRLTSGGLCLFSPVPGLGEAARASLADLGEVEFLLAPNHYHNKGLREYHEAFPSASICAPPEAQPRLQKITGLTFANLDRLHVVLPENTHLIMPQGLKTGEIWIGATAGQHKAWLVVDAFAGPKGKPGTVASDPGLLGTFAKFGVGDRAAYLTWIERQFQKNRPTMVLPCHGNMIRSPHLAKTLQVLIQQNL